MTAPPLVTPHLWGVSPRGVPAADLHTGPGLRMAVGIGEAPLGLQGTAVRRTAEERWNAEELFARFALLSAEGTLAGRDPLTAA